jgi:CheY-like chemotaxis protein
LVAIARQVLEDVQQDFDNHLAIEGMLKQMLSPAFNKDSLPFGIKGDFIMSMKSILLIEHEPSIGEVLSACLSEFGGWRVTLSNSIQVGVDLCETAHPDAILLDTSTSETDALIFVEQLKQHSITQSIPIVLLSSRANWFPPKQLREMGFVGAIAKPFNPTTVTDQIAQLLGWGNRD